MYESTAQKQEDTEFVNNNGNTSDAYSLTWSHWN